MAQTVGEHDVTGPDDAVVAYCLVEDALVYRDVGGLALHEHDCLLPAARYHDVGPLPCASEGKLVLLNDIDGGNADAVRQPADDVPPHPLFRSEQQPTAPQTVPDAFLAVPVRGPQPDGGQIKCGIPVHFSRKKSNFSPARRLRGCLQS